MVALLNFILFRSNELSFLFFLTGFGFTVFFHGNLGLTLSAYLSIDFWGFLMILLTISIFFTSILSVFSEKFSFYFWRYLIFLLFCLLLFLVFLFSTTSTFLFYVFFELTVIPTFIIILGWGYSMNRLQASFYMLVYMLFASYPFLVGLLNFKLAGVFYSFMGFFYLAEPLPLGAGWVYLLVFIFLVKLPLFLVHLWLPKAHVDAPLLGSMVLAGVLLKMGGFGLLKMFTCSWVSFLSTSWFFSFFSLVGAFYMSVVCLRQLDLKSLIAYSSVVHMGPVFACFFLLSYYSLMGSFLLMFAHGLCSCGLFFLFNTVSGSYFSRSIYLVRGLTVLSPIYSYFWFSFCFFNMGCPPSFNFFSEILSFLSCMLYGELLLTIFFTLMLFGGFYCVAMMVSVCHGSSVGLSSRAPVSLTLCDLLVVILFLGFIFFFILFSSFFLC